MAKFESYNALLDEVMEELEEKGAEVEESRKNRNGKKPSDKKKKEASREEPQHPVIEREESLELPDIDLDEGGSSEESFEITAEGEPVITERVTFGESSRKIGEEVSEEYVNQLVEESSSPKGGRKATVIIHTRTVMESVSRDADEASDDYEIAGEPSAKRKEALPPDPAPAIHLVRKETGEIFDLHKGSQTLGSDEDNDIVIPEPDGHYISGHHAVINVDDKGKIFLTDGSEEKRSTNGTFVNGTKIGSRYLKNGDTIRFADIEFMLAVDTP